MKRRSFALQFSLALLALVILGFGTRAVFLPEYWPPVRFSLIVHIIVMAVWFVLVVAQSFLINERCVKTHMRVGRMGIAVAVLVVVTGALMIIELNQREFIWLQVLANAINMITFTIFFVAAMAWRKDRDSHMRMILFASLALMTPAFARLLQPIGAEALSIPAWLVMSGGIAVFDWGKRAQIHRATWFGLSVNVGFVIALMAAMAVIAPQPVGNDDAGTTAATAQSEASQPPSRASLADPNGYEGRIRLVRFLDEPDGYCFDVPGAGDRVMLTMPPIAHTCHFDPLADQVFAFNRGGDGLIQWRNAQQSVCLAADAAQAGARFAFDACGGSPHQSFDYTDRGEFRLRDTELCLSVEATGRSFDEQPNSEHDEFGRGRPVNPKYTHLARALVLDICGLGDPSLQRWQVHVD